MENEQSDINKEKEFLDNVEFKKEYKINWSIIIISNLMAFSLIAIILSTIMKRPFNPEAKIIFATVSLLIAIMAMSIISLDYLNHKNILTNPKRLLSNQKIRNIFLYKKNSLIPLLFDSEDISKTIERNIQNKIQETLSIKELNLINLLKSYKARLENEINNLNRKSNYNLTIGLIVTLMGACLLGNTIFFPPQIDQERWIYITQLITRFSILIFFEFFAFFFLRLYKNIQEDIKFYQNEMSNIELKTFAAMTALASNDSSLIKPIIEQLATTERNFVLKKGETTIGLERERMDRNEIIDLVRETIISTQRKSKK